MKASRRVRMSVGLVAASGMVIAGTVAAVPTQAGSKGDLRGLSLAAKQPVQKGDTITSALEAAKKAKGADGRAHVVVRLKDKPLASYTGGVAGLAATSPRGHRRQAPRRRLGSLAGVPAATSAAG